MRIVIVADNAVAAEAIRGVLRHVPGCEVLGFVNPRRACADTAGEAQPDVVIVDEMDDRGLALVRIAEFRAALPAAKLVLLVMRIDPDWLAEAAWAGIDAAIDKAMHPASVGVLLREVAANRVFHAFPAATAAGSASAGPGARAADALTRREFEILNLVVAGRPNGRIAAELCVTEQTVKFHLSNIYRKLGVTNRTEASHFVHVHGLMKALRPAPARPLPLMPVAA